MIFISMNIKKIIREEINSLSWIEDIDPYSFIKNYYDKFNGEDKISRMADDYAHLKMSKRNIRSLLSRMGYDLSRGVDDKLMLKALIKYYKENISFIKRFKSRFFYDDLNYEFRDLIDDFVDRIETMTESIDDLDWIRNIPAIEPYTISSEPNLYIDDSIVQNMDLPTRSNGKEKVLGDFKWTSGGMNYKFTAVLYPTTYASGKKMWRVIGTSGDHGFGYYWITKRNTLGKRARMQIFKQIIDKYKLDTVI